MLRERKIIQNTCCNPAIFFGKYQVFMPPRSCLHYYFFPFDGSLKESMVRLTKELEIADRVVFFRIQTVIPQTLILILILI